MPQIKTFLRLTLWGLEWVAVRDGDGEPEDAACVGRVVGADDVGLELVGLVLHRPAGDPRGRTLEKKG